MTSKIEDGSFVLLDPSKPAGQQSASQTIEKVYERYMPELSVLADRIFKDRMLQLKAKEARVVSIWVPVQVKEGVQGVPQAALVDSYGKTVSPQDVNPEVKLPVRTPKLDPRVDPYKGNLDLLTSYIAHLLAKHISDQKDRVESKTGKKMVVCTGDLEIIAEVPMKLKHTVINNLRLSATCPLLYGRVFVHMREE